MSWRIAKSLEELRTQVNKRAPNRSKASDGSIGDAKHASRSSDHNPHVKDGKTGVVTAIDITHDPAGGCDSYALAQSLIDSRDVRIKYIISNGKIASGADGPSAWVWRPYTGANPHSHHVHISVRAKKELYDGTAPWKFDLGKPDGAKPLKTNPVLSKGAKGDEVRRLQGLLNSKGANPTLTLDGDFGAKTEKAVKAFQSANGLVADSIVGTYTWLKLES